MDTKEEIKSSEKYQCAYCRDQYPLVTFYDDGNGFPVCEDCYFNHVYLNP